MSKRSYYRRYRRTYPKQKWQMTVSNLDLLFPIEGFVGNTWYSKHQVICQTVVPTNSSATGVVSSNNIVKTGNFKIKGQFEVSSGQQLAGILSGILYVIFVPQGITPDNLSAVSKDNLATSIFYSHPEWVLGWTRVDLDTQGSDNFSISSRLKRNLNSGDQIMFGALVMNNSTNTSVGTNYSIEFRATAQYCARAN